MITVTQLAWLAFWMIVGALVSGADYIIAAAGTGVTVGFILVGAIIASIVRWFKCH